MSLKIDFDAADDDKPDLFHSHGYAKIAYGPYIGSASSVPGGGRAGEGEIGAVGTYHYADVSYRHKRDSAGNKDTSSTDDSSRYKLKVEERPDKDKAAYSHRDPAELPVHTFREPPGRSYNPYA